MMRITLQSSQYVNQGQVSNEEKAPTWHCGYFIDLEEQRERKIVFIKMSFGFVIKLIYQVLRFSKNKKNN